MPVNLKTKIGVLLVNLGTPDDPSYGSVWRYLQQFLTDGRVIDIPWLPRQLLVRGIIAPFRSNSSAKLYKQLWTKEGSPLKFYGEYKLILRNKHGRKLANQNVSDQLQPNIHRLIYGDLVLYVAHTASTY